MYPQLSAANYSIKNLDANTKYGDFSTTFYGEDKIVFSSSRSGSGNNTISLKQPIESDNSLYAATTTISTTTKYSTNIPSAKNNTKKYAPSPLPLSSSYTQQHGAQHHQRHVYNNTSTNDEYHKYYQQQQLMPPSSTSSSAYYNNPDQQQQQ